jgi:hypothetical protein
MFGFSASISISPSSAGVPGGVARRGDHREYRLAVESTRSCANTGRRRALAKYRSSRYVRRGDDGDDARRAQHLGKIDPPIVPRAIGEPPTAICMVPTGSGISSIYSGRALHAWRRCRAAAACTHGAKALLKRRHAAASATIR